MSRRTSTNGAAAAVVAAENDNGQNSSPSTGNASADGNAATSPRSPTGAVAITTSNSTATTSRGDIESNEGDNSSTADNAKAEPPLLYKHVLAKNWTQVLARLTEAPKESQFLDDFGLSPLHRACYRDAPVGVVQALIDASNPTLLATQDKCDFSGLTPLHAACHYCSPEVVKVLLKANPEALERRNTKHQTPLECTCQVYNNRIRHTLDRTTKEMVAHDDIVMATSNGRNRVNANADGIQSNSAAAVARRPEYADLLTEDATLRRFFKVACLLLQAQVGTPLMCTLAGDEEDESVIEGRHCDCAPKTNMVQACAMAATTVPHILLELCLKLYPEQVRAVTGTWCKCLQNNTSSCSCSGKGNTPLHEALECAGRNLRKSHSNNTIITHAIRLQQKHFLKNLHMILDAHPEATLIKNVDFEVPFVVARRCDLSWSLGMQTLLQHHPQALYSVPNLVLTDKTVCHVLAKAGGNAAAEESLSKDETEENAKKADHAETAATSLLFGLLQCHPSVMQYASTSEVVIAASNTKLQPLKEASHVTPLRPDALGSSSSPRSANQSSSNRSLGAGLFMEQQNEFKETMWDKKHLDRSQPRSSSRFSLTLWKTNSNKPKKSTNMRRCQSENGLGANQAPPPTASAQTPTAAPSFSLPLSSASKPGTSSSRHNHTKRDANVSPLSLPWLVQKLIGSVGNGSKRSANNSCARHSSACGCAAEPESTK